MKDNFSISESKLIDVGRIFLKWTCYTFYIVLILSNVREGTTCDTVELLVLNQCVCFAALHFFAYPYNNCLFGSLAKFALLNSLKRVKL